MSEWTEYEDPYIPGDGEAEQSWEEYEDASEVEQLQAEIDALREQMQASQGIDYASLPHHMAQAQEQIRHQAEEAEQEQHLQDELVTLQNHLGRDLNASEWASINHVVETIPAGERSLIAAWEASQDIPRAERMNIHMRSLQNPSGPESFMPDSNDWAAGGEDRAQDRQASILARLAMEQGQEYVDGDE